MQAEQLQEHRVGRELAGHGLLAHGVAAVFDHHRLAVVNLDEGQRLGQGLGGGPAGFFGLVGHGRPGRRLKRRCPDRAAAPQCHAGASIEFRPAREPEQSSPL
jgi:hypothetical protein